MKVKSDSQLNDISLIGIYGYPGNRPKGTLWYSSGNITRVDPKEFYCNAALFPGNSGSPVVDMADYNYVIGIYTANTDLGQMSVRISTDIIKFVKDF
ncbi:trypsin-like peptidase domain-containing protein [Pseudoflavonifractor sp. 60]|uniref:trypsin-like serine peptidase n=1 Tax=Pseudoflavonifractor sp. 60 TaxID=2304576 RepID=UPI00136EE56C|nr:trypsin-like peptidase domain-containing protein [Pseudoflavonifractor sp. 60]